MLVVAAAVFLLQLAQEPPPRLRLDVPPLAELVPAPQLARRPGQTLFTLSIAANAADLGTTYAGMRYAGIHEGNPSMRLVIDRPAAAIAVKAAYVLGAEALARRADQTGRRTLARVVRVSAVAWPVIGMAFTARATVRGLRANARTPRKNP